MGQVPADKVEDDLVRELAFYSQVGTRAGAALLERCWHQQSHRVGALLPDAVHSVPQLLQALAAAKDAVRRFKEEGKPWLRPTDYYAEMVKSDEHMAKVKQQLMHEQKSIQVCAAPDLRLDVAR